MTIHDLNWHPAMIGEGMIAVEHFSDGTTMYVRFEHNTYGFTSYTSERRVLDNRQGLDRDEVNRLINIRAFLSALSRA